MVFDDILKSMVPQKMDQELVFQDSRNVDELYREWYRLQILKVESEYSHELHSNITYNILENVINELSDQKQLESNLPARHDAITKLNDQKKEFSSDTANTISDIDSKIVTIKKAIEEYAKSRLYSDNFILELKIKPDHDLRYGNIFLSGITQDNVLPIYYLFNDAIPRFNIMDENIADTIGQFYPDRVKAHLQELKEYYHNDPDSNYTYISWDYLKKYFDYAADSDFSIPLFLIEQNGDFSDVNMSCGKYDTNLFHFKLKINGEYHGKIYKNEGHFGKGSVRYNQIYENEKLVYDLIRSSYTSHRGLESRLPRDDLNLAAGKIIAKFYSQGISSKLMVQADTPPIR